MGKFVLPKDLQGVCDIRAPEKAKGAAVGCAFRGVPLGKNLSFFQDSKFGGNSMHGEVVGNV